MRRTLPLVLLALVLSPLMASVARADIDEIELRKAKSGKLDLGFSFIGLYELGVGLNRDRGEVSSLLYLAPQLKIGSKMRARVNFGVYGNSLGRQDNPWDLMDVQLQFSHLGFYKEKYTGVDFSGYVRYYFPTSKLSRNEGSFGQLRGTLKLSRTFWDKLFFSFEFNLQKYFHRYTTWSTEVSDVQYSAGLDEYIENNASFGFGETFTVTYSPIAGLDLSAIYGLIQTRQYGGGSATGISGSSLVDSRMTRSSYSTRLTLDATIGLSALPWWKGKFIKDQILDRLYVSIGYANLSPQLVDGHHHFNPFDPRFAQAYFDLMVLY